MALRKAQRSPSRPEYAALHDEEMARRRKAITWLRQELGASWPRVTVPAGLPPRVQAHCRAVREHCARIRAQCVAQRVRYVQQREARRREQDLP